MQRGPIGLLQHIANDSISLTRSRVVSRATTSEDLDSGVTLDVLATAEVLLNGTIDLGNLDIVLLEGGGSNLVLGSYSEWWKGSVIRTTQFLPGTGIIFLPRALQWPHQGAKNSTKVTSSFLMWESKVLALKSTTSLLAWTRVRKAVAAAAKTKDVLTMLYKISCLKR